jgi:hypothetical protein
VASNFANIQNVLLWCLSFDKTYLAGIIHSSLEIIRYSRTSGHGVLPLSEHVQKFLPQLTDHKLDAYFIIQLLNGWQYHPSHNAPQLIDQALEHFKHFHDPDMKCELILDPSVCSPELKQP